jgi:ABC-2 type transport system permease protein
MTTVRLSKAWTIATKDFAIFRRKTSLRTSLVAFPLIVSVALPVIVWLLRQRDRVPTGSLPPLFDSFLFFFLIVTVVNGVNLASYSIVGEKVERSLEPLLATPTTDREILLGKTLAAFLPTLASTFLGATIFMGLIDALFTSEIGYLYFPNWSMVVLLFVAIPLACLCGVEANVIISSRVSDVRTAQQYGSLLAIPFGGLYVLGETKLVTLESTTNLEISLVLLVADLLLLWLSRAIFQREEILTRWK